MALLCRVMPNQTGGQRRTMPGLSMFYMDESSITSFPEKAFGNHTYELPLVGIKDKKGATFNLHALGTILWRTLFRKRSNYKILLSIW